MSPILFENAEILDGTEEGRVPGHVLVEGQRIAEVSDRPIASAAARRIDLRGATEGLRAARNEGLFPAPRMVLCGHQAARSPRQPGAVAMSTLMRSRGTQGAAPARRGRSRSARFLMAISWTWKAAS